MPRKTEAEIAREFRDAIREAARLALDRTGRADMPVAKLTAAAEKCVAALESAIFLAKLEEVE